MTDRIAVSTVRLVFGLVFAGVAAAGDLGAGVVNDTSRLPWIAIAVVFGLLGVISFASRRRMYSVVGS